MRTQATPTQTQPNPPALLAPPGPPALPCAACEGSGRCPNCGDERAVSVRRRCEDCAGLSVCPACHGTGGALMPVRRGPPAA